MDGKRAVRLTLMGFAISGCAGDQIPTSEPDSTPLPLVTPNPSVAPTPSPGLPLSSPALEPTLGPPLPTEESVWKIPDPQDGCLTIGPDGEPWTDISSCPPDTPDYEAPPLFDENTILNELAIEETGLKVYLFGSEVSEQTVEEVYHSTTSLFAEMARSAGIDEETTRGVVDTLSKMEGSCALYDITPPGDVVLLVPVEGEGQLDAVRRAFLTGDLSPLLDPSVGIDARALLIGAESIGSSTVRFTGSTPDQYMFLVNVSFAMRFLDDVWGPADIPGYVKEEVAIKLGFANEVMNPFLEILKSHDLAAYDAFVRYWLGPQEYDWLARENEVRDGYRSAIVERNSSQGLGTEVNQLEAEVEYYFQRAIEEALSTAAMFQVLESVATEGESEASRAISRLQDPGRLVNLGQLQNLRTLQRAWQSLGVKVRSMRSFGGTESGWRARVIR